MKPIALLFTGVVLGPLVGWRLAGRTDPSPEPLVPPTLAPGLGRAPAPESRAADIAPPPITEAPTRAGVPSLHDTLPGAGLDVQAPPRTPTSERRSADGTSKRTLPYARCSRCDRLTDQVAFLTRQVRRLEGYGGQTPFRHLMASGYGDDLGPEELDELEALMGYECPFYLQPGEASEVLRIERGEGTGAGSATEQLIRFLGPRRVLDEAPREWVRRTYELLGDDEWRRIFGTPPPSLSEAGP